MWQLKCHGGMKTKLNQENFFISQKWILPKIKRLWACPYLHKIINLDFNHDYLYIYNKNSTNYIEIAWFDSE